MELTYAQDKSCMQAPQSSSIQGHQVPLATNAGTIFWDTSTCLPGAPVQPTYRHLVFDTLNELSRPGIEASLRLAAA